MEKRSKKSILISVTCLLLVMLLLVGLTYAYYRTRIIGNESEEPSISVTSKKLEIVYGDGSGAIEGIKIEPPFTKTKTFTVTNTGDEAATYSIYLDDVINTFERMDDITYTLTCQNGDGTSCNGVTSTEYPDVDSLLVSNIIEANETNDYKQTYTFTLTYVNLENADQSIDMGKMLKGKIQIYSDYNPYEEGTLAHTIYANNDINGRRVSFTAPAKTDEGIFSAPDDYGTSYYFRGDVKNNFVKFAGLDWRIVRINGDGSVRLILEYVLHDDKVYSRWYANDFNINNTNSVKGKFNPYSTDNAYIGYMYGLPETTTNANRCLISEDGATIDKITTYTTKEMCEANNGKWTTTAYEATHANVTNSYMKNTVDHFYEDYLSNSQDYLADVIFCNDKTIAPKNYGINNTGLGYGRNITFYGIAPRIMYKTAKDMIEIANPSFRCANSASDDFSRLTVEKYTTSSGIKTNGDLTYPIGLLTADEYIFAGGFRGQNIDNLYLVNSYGTQETLTNAFATMTPGYLNSDQNLSAILTASKNITNCDTTQNNSARPVINIKANVLVDSGNGTSDSPYTLKLS